MIQKQKLLWALIASVLASIQSNAVSTIIEVFHSDTMNKNINYRVVLPNTYSGRGTDPDKVFPVLYCLHGAGSSEEPWSVMSPLNSAIDGDYPAILVTFFAENSWYIDTPGNSSSQYTTFFFDELVPFIESTYRAGGKPGLRAVTGFSMGGYGAWHYMLEKPDFFSSVSGLSGAFNRSPSNQTQWNPYTQITEMATNSITLPPTYMNCGTADGLISDNRNMKTHLTNNGYTTTLVETTGAGHDWPFWRDSSDEIIAFHYQYFSDAEAPAIWRGIELTGTSAETATLGWLDVAQDPWSWSYSLENWVYLSPAYAPQTGGWAYLPK